MGKLRFIEPQRIFLDEVFSIPCSPVHYIFTKILTAGYSVLPFVDETLFCFHRYHILIRIRLFAHRTGWKCTSLTTSYLVSTIELPNFNYFFKNPCKFAVIYVRLDLSTTAIFEQQYLMT